MRPTDRHALWLTAAFLVIFGCTNRPADETDAKSNQAESAASTDHGHGSGPHGGVVADWSGGKYHVEFTVDHDKRKATVYVLADDAATPAPIKTDKLLLTINEPAFQVELAAAPAAGEGGNASSRFVGQHENLGIVREFAGTISGEVDGTPYAGDFKEEAGHDHE